MKNVYLVSYSVNGIKSINEMIDISFYKKTIRKPIDTTSYNIKGIYGINGSGKSGIVNSISILKNILCNLNYLNNPVVQSSLDELIHKGTRTLHIKLEFLFDYNSIIRLYHYELILIKNPVDQYVIDYEHLSQYASINSRDKCHTLFKVLHGEIVDIYHNKLSDSLIHESTNLLSTTSLCNLFYKHVLTENNHYIEDNLFIGLCALYIFSNKLHVYLDNSDEHTNYFISKYIHLNDYSNMSHLLQNLKGMDQDNINTISIENNIVPIDKYNLFEKKVSQLKAFIKIFKSNLKDIEIEKKINDQVYVCNLIMVYDTCKISAEFESTGIKKLILLYAYINEMVLGDIVFIDEFDANLHDVYLCALLEYLMRYGKGQLCFTTHNVGPMNILKYNKKSIDFLSQDQKIYSWKTNGNYSPSNLYREGMIEGSPFNIESIDFIGIFDEEVK